jgi:hypothetical protein
MSYLCDVFVVCRHQGIRHGSVSAQSLVHCIVVVCMYVRLVGSLSTGSRRLTRRRVWRLLCEWCDCRDLVADQQILEKENPLTVARNSKIINADSEEPKYIINIRQVFAHSNALLRAPRNLCVLYVVRPYVCVSIFVRVSFDDHSMPSMWWHWVKRYHPPTLRRACVSGTSHRRSLQLSSVAIPIPIRFCVSTLHSSFTFLIHRAYNVVRVGLPLRAAVSSAKSIRFKFLCHPKSIRPSP